MSKQLLKNVTITLQGDKTTADKIAILVQRGFLVEVDGPITIEELLLDLPGFSRDYIRDRVQTIFVNGLAEDDTRRLLVPGSTLALSAAMPGLAGAIFRRGGRHGSLRTRPAEEKRTTEMQAGQVTVKLFNMIATETGPRILENGMRIKGAVLGRFLDRQAERILPLIAAVQMDGQPVEAAALGPLVAGEPEVFLTIRG